MAQGKKRTGAKATRTKEIWSDIKVRQSADNELTITFPTSITDFVTPIANKRTKEIPIEFLLITLSRHLAGQRMKPPRMAEFGAAPW